MIDEQGKIISINEAFTQITGYSPYEILGRSPKFFKVKKHYTSFYRNLVYEVLKYGYWHGHIWLCKKNGVQQQYCLVVTSIEGSSGQKYYISTFQDSSHCSEQENADSNSTNRNNEKITYFHLQKAMAEEQFELHYQPLMHITDGKIIGLETLIRWNHPTKGSISPNIFIPIAEKTGLIIPIGERVLKQSFEAYQVLQTKGSKNLKLMINVSVKQLEHKDFSQFVANLVKEYAFDTKNIEFEITESIFLNPSKNVLRNINQLRQLGIQLSLDDFGTGYSAFNYLKRLPFNTLKIDREFIRDVKINSTNSILVEMMITMGKNLGLNVIAEGVETSEQIDFLRENQCEVVQGYYYSKPLPINDLIDFIDNIAV